MTQKSIKGISFLTAFSPVFEQTVSFHPLMLLSAVDDSLNSSISGSFTGRLTSSSASISPSSINYCIGQPQNLCLEILNLLIYNFFLVPKPFSSNLFIITSFASFILNPFKNSEFIMTPSSVYASLFTVKLYLHNL